MAYVPVDVNKSVLRECQRRRLSPRTAQTYLYCINRFFKFYKNKELGKISKKDVRKFLDYLSEKRLSGSSMNIYHMAIRFLFQEVLNKKMWIDIKYSKTPKKLPVVLDKCEVKRLFECIKNEKHRLMIELLYSAGLRVSALTNLRVLDLEIDKGHGFVRGGKGGKDRIFILSERLRDKIKNLIEKEKLENENYLFTSLRNKKYHIKSIQKIIENASKITKIEKNVHPHTLRHSFATHLIENGYDVNQVQALLGHKSPETTMIYVHMASPSIINIKSPLDNL